MKELLEITNMTTKIKRLDNKIKEISGSKFKKKCKKIKTFV